MNIGAIRKECLGAKRFLLLEDQTGGQWISSGRAAYRVEGIHLDAGAIPALFNLTDKQAGKCTILSRTADDWRYDGTVDPEREEPLDDLGAIWWGGMLFIALRGALGLMYVAADALKPVKADDGYRQYFARWEDGAPLIAVYGDLFCAALVEPCSTEGARTISAAAMTIAREELFQWPDPEQEAADAEAAAEAALKQIGIDDMEDDGSEGD